jgi:hypothetical protein
MPSALPPHAPPHDARGFARAPTGPMSPELQVSHTHLDDCGRRRPDHRTRARRARNSPRSHARAALDALDALGADARARAELAFDLRVASRDAANDFESAAMSAPPPTTSGALTRSAARPLTATTATR